MKNISDFGWLVIGIVLLTLVVVLNDKSDSYKHQILIPTVCDEYLTVKKADVPIACYEYFGIK